MNSFPNLKQIALPLVLLMALGLRLYNLGFGLPSLYDPDEPLFVIKAVELLTDRTLNPRWFGHPGTTTIYLTMLTSVAVVGWGLLIGSWSSIDEFTRAGYADPGLLFIPVRAVMALLAVVCVWLTYHVGRRLCDRVTGLIAAALLAINSLHVTWSQVIRTDIGASVFMMGALYFAIRIAQRGALRDYLWAGVLTGIAIATKWPASSIFIAVIGAAIARSRSGEGNWRTELQKLVAAGAAAIAALLASSPFLLLDWQTVLADLSGEARPVHLGHTGTGFLSNLITYFQSQVAGSMGWIGLVLIIAGVTVSMMRTSAIRWTLLPAAIAFIIMISAQQLVWSRWVLPAMPMLVIFAAVGLVWMSERIAQLLGTQARPVIAALFAVAAVPSAIDTVGTIRERRNDTRAMAAGWATKHIPPGSSVALEHLELSLRAQPWKLLFPVGEAGCIDGRRALQAGVRYDNVNRLRKGSPIVNLGNVSAEKLESCRADYAILTYFDLYNAEARVFPTQYANYRTLLAGGKTVALFRPIPGQSGGPVVRIVALSHR